MVSVRRKSGIKRQDVYPVTGQRLVVGIERKCLAADIAARY